MMILHPTNTSSTAKLLANNPAANLTVVQPLGAGGHLAHDSSPTINMFHVVTPMSHLLPDKFTHPKPLTRQERVSAWTEFWNNLTKNFKRDQPFPFFLTTLGRQTGGPDPMPKQTGGAEQVPQGLRYD